VSATGVKQFLRARKSLVASVTLHTVIIGWGLISFSIRSLEAKPEEYVPVDVISDEKFSQLTLGMKSGDKTVDKQMADKIGDPKPVDDAVGKINDKKPPIAPTADNELPKPDDKPIDKKPEPKPVVQDKPKAEPKPAERKEEPKVDQIAEQLKKDQAKEPPKPEAKQTPQPPKPKKEYKHDASKVAALLNQQDPTRQSITGQQLSPKSALGVPAGQAQKLTMSWLGTLQKRISDCWVVPAGIRDAETMEIRLLVRFGPNGMLLARPELVEAPPASRSVHGPAFAESAIRAIEQCQPYSFLPPSEYKGGWDFIDMTFTPQDLFRR